MDPWGERNVWKAAPENRVKVLSQIEFTNKEFKI